MTATLPPSPIAASVARKELAIKGQYAACLFLYKQAQMWVATASDAVEICFCTGLPLPFKPTSQSDEGTIIRIAPDKIGSVLDRLSECGNPVALIDYETGEVQTFWPPERPAVDYSLDDEEQTYVIQLPTPAQEPVAVIDNRGGFTNFSTVNPEDVFVPF